MLSAKTRFEQVPVEIVKRIKEEQIRREEVVKLNRGSFEESFELEVWEAPGQPFAQFQPFSQGVKKPS